MGATSVVPCDDGNPCTINDEQTIITSTGTICIPCQGVAQDCMTTGATTVQPCDDGDASTTNDVETILNCDGSICIPCMGNFEKNNLIIASNIFSPNNDGVNDIFRIYFDHSIERILKFRIFDRWGSEVLFKKDILIENNIFEWDGRMNGTMLTNGVYVFVVQYAYLNGEEDIYKGNVTIIK